MENVNKVNRLESLDTMSKRDFDIKIAMALADIENGRTKHIEEIEKYFYEEHKKHKCNGK